MAEEEEEQELVHRHRYQVGENQAATANQVAANQEVRNQKVGNQAMAEEEEELEVTRRHRYQMAQDQKVVPGQKAARDQKVVLDRWLHRRHHQPGGLAGWEVLVEQSTSMGLGVQAVAERQVGEDHHGGLVLRSGFVRPVPGQRQHVRPAAQRAMKQLGRTC